MEHLDFEVGASLSLHRCPLRLAGRPVVTGTENAPIRRFIPAEAETPDGEEWRSQGRMPP